MSHFSEVKSKMTDRELLEETLKSLKLEFKADKAGIPIRGFMGECAKAEICVDTGLKYDLGLEQMSDGTFQFIADFEVLDSTPAKNLRNQVMQTYAYLSVKKVAHERGFEIEEEIREDGQIQMVVSQW